MGVTRLSRIRMPRVAGFGVIFAGGCVKIT